MKKMNNIFSLSMYLPKTLNKPFIIICARDSNGGIGKDGHLPLWNCPEDMRNFKTITCDSRPFTCNAVIMGRKTWESLKGPLVKRINVIISSNKYDDLPDNTYVFSSLIEAHYFLNEQNVDKQFIIGGYKLYSEVIKNNWAHSMIISTIYGDYECDTFFPNIPPYWISKRSESLGKRGSKVEYHNYYTRHLEQLYLDRMCRLLTCSSTRGRNGEVFSSFNWRWSTDLSDGLPLFSTRRSFWKGICKELLFFIKGLTDTKILERDGINIWKGNTSLDFLNSRDLPYNEGDMGPMYGWVWRHSGEKYSGANMVEYGGFDQLHDVIDKLLNDRSSRRILLTTYEPSKVSDSVLAPCHGIVCQFYVRTEGDVKYLDMYTYQRSADMFLGVNFNIPSYATLQTIISYATGLTPGKMHYEFGDTHVYASHVSAVKKVISRLPNETFPTLKIVRPLPAVLDVNHSMNWIEGLIYEDFKISGYSPNDPIKADMVI